MRRDPSRNWRRLPNEPSNPKARDFWRQAQSECAIIREQSRIFLHSAFGLVPLCRLERSRFAADSFACRRPDGRGDLSQLGSQRRNALLPIYVRSCLRS